MSKEKQIEEMGTVVRDVIYKENEKGFSKGFEALCTATEYLTEKITEALYNADYRKQSEGHWFILEYEYFTCSECGYYHPNGCDSTREAKEKLAEGIVPKYCSECGAKMKGV